MHRGEFAISSKDIWSSDLPRKFTVEELGILEAILCCYGPMDPEDISMLVHKAGPYKLTEEGEVIPKELIKEYYRIHNPMEPNIWSEND
jgi:hypothetical protein